MNEARNLEELGRRNRRDAVVAIIILVVIVGGAIWVVRTFNPGYSREPFRRTEYLLDTQIALAAYGKDQRLVEETVEAALQEIRRIDVMTDRFDPESELSRLNRSAAAGPVPVSEDLFEMLARSMEMYHASGGAFDVTQGTLSDLWDVNNRVAPPSDAEIAAAMAKAGARHLRLDAEAGTVSVDLPGLIIDLGGVAKGYAVELASARMRVDGVTAALIDSVSSSETLGRKPDDTDWIIAVTDPRDANRHLARLSLPGDSSISTSGDYQRYFEFEGIRFHHILDPATGRPSAASMSVTVIGATGSTEADMLSTAAFILGYPRGLELLLARGAEGILVDVAGVVHVTPGLSGRLELDREVVTAP
ncbi:MAG: FAD:protein FMN transferase [Candidatus Geothermincolia bacterium]